MFGNSNWNTIKVSNCYLDYIVHVIPLTFSFFNTISPKSKCIRSKLLFPNSWQSRSLQLLQNTQTSACQDRVAEAMERTHSSSFHTSITRRYWIRAFRTVLNLRHFDKINAGSASVVKPTVRTKSRDVHWACNFKKTFWNQDVCFS